MATEADIEMVETFTPKNFDDRSSTQESKSEDDDKDKDVSIGDRNDVHKSDRKIGHRRVGVGGEITYKKVPTTQIMGSIQLGIQHAVGGLASKPERDLLMQDFMTVETTNFPHEGSNHTPAHHYSEFKFKTYAPIAFRYFRDLFGIQPDDFLMSMCSSPLRELSNPGASGSIFYLTEDDEFIIKTVQHKEGEFLQKLLPGYYMNLNQNPRTLLPKFFGLYCYQCNSKNVRLVAMNNLLPSVVKLHQKYDLKGSTYKRKASKSERIKKSPTYKDLDFMEHHPQGLFLEADTHGALVKTIQRDCRVLESFKIMDYSLLVGVHNLDKAQREKAEELAKEAEGKVEEEGAAGERSMLTRTRSEQKTKEDFSNQVRRTQSINRQRLVAHSTAMESIQAESEPIDEEEDVPPGGIPARNEKGERLLLFVGVIDILQSYRFRKKLEHTWKSMIHDGDTVSVHRPNFYAQRFQDFMAKKVFMKIPSLDLPEIKGNHRKFRTLVTSYIALKHSPSKRKSISRPLRQQEDLETSGPGTSSNTNNLHLPSGPDSLPSYQFPRVLWADPQTPRLRTVESPSDEEDESFPRIPSPGSAAMRAFWGSDVDAFYEHNSAASKLDSSTPKSGNQRKISFAVDRGDQYLRCDSVMSSTSSSIVEAMKDMPFIDGIEEPFGDRPPEGDAGKTHSTIKEQVTDSKKTPDKEAKGKVVTPEKGGLFGRFKKAFVDFFVGEEEEIKALSDTGKKEEDNSTNDKNLKIIVEEKVLNPNNEITKDNPTPKNTGRSINKSVMNTVDIAVDAQNVKLTKGNNGEVFNSLYFVKECSNEDFVVMSYEENHIIDIAEDIEICTNFAEGNSLVSELDASWLRSRRSKSLSRDPRTKEEMDLEGICQRQKIRSLRVRKRESMKVGVKMTDDEVLLHEHFLKSNNKVTIKEYNEKGVLKNEEVIEDISNKTVGDVANTDDSVVSEDEINLRSDCDQMVWGNDDEILKFDERMMNDYDDKSSRERMDSGRCLMTKACDRTTMKLDVNSTMLFLDNERRTNEITGNDGKLEFDGGSKLINKTS